MQVLNEKVLVLNKNYYVLCSTTVKSALKLIFTDKAVVMNGEYQSYSLEEWKALQPSDTDQIIRTPNIVFVVPEVIRLTDFDQVINLPINLTKYNIFLRDDFTCQYCGDTDKLTIDHIIPRSRASEFKLHSKQINSWENMTTCCAKCNNKKSSQIPEEAQMTLLSKPTKPRQADLMFDRKSIKETWKRYLNKDTKCT
jgi:5-methylcytosine-specific restriction endonuclease McrA